VAVADLPQAREEAGRRDDEPSLALDRFHDDGGHVLGGHLRGEEPRQVVEAVLGEVLRPDAARRSVEVREAAMVDLGRAGPEALAKGLVFAVQGEAEQGPPVERVVEAHDRLPLGERAGAFHRVLDRFRPAVEEDGLLAARTRRRLRQLAAHRDVVLVRRDVEARVQQPAGLLFKGGGHLRVAMADVHGADPPSEIDVLLPVDVPELRVGGPFHDDGGVARAPGGDELLALLPDRSRPGQAASALCSFRHTGV